MNKTAAAYVAGLLALMTLAYLNLMQGPIDISFSEMLSSILGTSAEELKKEVVLGIRLPRVLIAMGVGGVLGLCGYLFQLVVKNPLADPYILGTSTGAALGANLVLAGVIGSGFFMGYLLPSIGALVGGFLTTIVAIFLAMRNGHIHAPTLLLAGVGLASINTALISLIAYLVKPGSQLKVIIFWIMGSFERSNMSHVVILWIGLAIAILILLRIGPGIMGLWLEEDRAKSLGIPVQSVKWIVLLMATVLTSLAVSFSGAIGFVGFIIPHFARALFGSTNANSLWFSILTGASFMLACDWISRAIYPPVGLPIGIVTSFIGIPFFLYLLRKRGYVFS